MSTGHVLKGLIRQYAYSRDIGVDREGSSLPTKGARKML